MDALAEVLRGLRDKVKVSLFRPTLWPRGLQSMGFSRPEYWSGQPFPSSGDLPNPGIEPRSPALQADSLTAEPPGKPKNTGVGSHSLLQWISPTKESNWGLLHCRRILYQLNYQGRILICYHLSQNHSIPDTMVLLFLEHFHLSPHILTCLSSSQETFSPGIFMACWPTSFKC